MLNHARPRAAPEQEQQALFEEGGGVRPLDEEPLLSDGEGDEDLDALLEGGSWQDGGDGGGGGRPFLNGSRG